MHEGCHNSEVYPVTRARFTDDIYSTQQCMHRGRIFGHVNSLLFAQDITMKDPSGSILVSRSDLRRSLCLIAFGPDRYYPECVQYSIFLFKSQSTIEKKGWRTAVWRGRCCTAYVKSVSITTIASVNVTGKKAQCVLWDALTSMDRSMRDFIRVGVPNTLYRMFYGQWDSEDFFHRLWVSLAVEHTVHNISVFSVHESLFHLQKWHRQSFQSGVLILLPYI